MARRRGAPKRSAVVGRWSDMYRKQRARFRLQCERVGAACHLCGQAIDYDVPAGEPDAWECDHFYPVETHPELYEDPANFRPSHKSCNSSRGTDDVRPVLGTLSEEW